MKFVLLLLVLTLSVSEGREATVTRPSKDTYAELRANQELKKRLLTGYDKHVHPTNGDQPVKVSIGLSIIHIHELDERTNTLTLEIWVRLVWKDPRFTWTNTSHPHSVIRIPSSQVWRPDILLYNSVGGESLNTFRDTNVLVYPDGEVLWVPQTTTRSICSSDILHYPFDSHTCTLDFGSWTHDVKEIVLTPHENSEGTGPDMSDFWLNSMWDVSDLDRSFRRQHFACCPDPHDVTEFSLRLTRRSAYFNTIHSAPSLVVIMLTLAVFWLPPQAGERITLGCFALGIVMLLIIYLAWTLPPNPWVAPRIASFCSILLLEVTVVILLSVVSIAKTRREQSGPPRPLANFLLNGWVGKVLCLESLRPLVTNDGNTTEPITEDLTPDTHSGRSDDKRSLRLSWLAFMMALDRILFVAFLLILGIQYIVCFV